MAAELMVINPARRRGKKKTTRKRRKSRARVTTARRNPVRRRRSPARRTSYARRNPVRRRSRRRSGGKMTMTKMVQNTIVPAGIGAIGAVALDVLWGLAPIPAQFKTGMLGTGVKVGGILVLGFVGSKVLPKKYVDVTVAAAVTIAIFQAVRGMVQQTIPTLPLSEYISEYPNLDFINAGPVIPGMPVSEYISGDGYENQGVGNYYGEVIY